MEDCYGTRSSFVPPNSLTLLLNILSPAKLNLPYDVAFNDGIPRPWREMPSIEEVSIALQENEDFLGVVCNINLFSNWTPAVVSKFGSSKESFVRIIEKFKFKFNSNKILNLFMQSTTEIRGDKEIVMKVVSKCGMALEFASNELREDREVVETAIRNSGGAIQYALIIELPLVYLALSKDIWSLSHISHTYGSNRSVMEFAVSRIGLTLLCASAELCDDYDLVVIAILQDVDAFAYASPRLLANKDVIMLAILKDGGALRHVKEKDDYMVAIAIKTYGAALQWASDSGKDDYDLVSAAIAQNGKALKYASSRLRADRSMAIRAVAGGCILKYISKELRDDREIVMIAVGCEGRAIRWASERLKNDIELIKHAFNVSKVKKGAASIIYHIGKEACDNWEVINLAINQSSNYLYYASSRLLNDKYLAIASVSKHCGIMQNLNPILRNNREVAISAVLRCDTAINRCGDDTYRRIYSLHDRIIHLLVLGW